MVVIHLETLPMDATRGNIKIIPTVILQGNGNEVDSARVAVVRHRRNRNDGTILDILANDRGAAVGVAVALPPHRNEIQVRWKIEPDILRNMVGENSGPDVILVEANCLPHVSTEGTTKQGKTAVVARAGTPTVQRVEILLRTGGGPLVVLITDITAKRMVLTGAHTENKYWGGVGWSVL